MKKSIEEYRIDLLFSEAIVSDLILIDKLEELRMKLLSERRMSNVGYITDFLIILKNLELHLESMKRGDE
jgi:hypothetical protein